ncbi:MAG: DEDD exonuclease domain-containing protein [Acidimicrobiales bacterium]|nr:DEDD exonuclease domain-containing protein [Acidimicrobiales bacterium]
MQRTFDDLGTPLIDVTFCVIDLETTGGLAEDVGITEIGAVKLRGGECLGTFQTLVNPGAAIPPTITMLTGITQAMVLPAPRIESVLPTLLEFIGDAVIVGHNVSYDLRFLRAATDRGRRPPLANAVVDTCRLARRLLSDEVPNHKLGTLADRLRLPHQPSHRALDDALATGDLLHVLLERAGRLGVSGLDDLLALPKLAAHPQVGKLALTNRLPRTAGVYVFKDRRGQPLYVGKATNLRTRVRSYFSGERRRKVAQLLRETEHIDHIVCPGPLEAEILEVRLIQELLPRFNRQGTRWRSYTYVKLTCNERFPRLSVVRSTPADGGLYLGPLSSTRYARLVVEAIESVVPVRRCSTRIGGSLRLDRTPVREAPCTAAQLGVSTCPCSGATSEAEYGAIVDRLVHALVHDPAALLEPLADKMAALALAERYEEAADVRDRAAALAKALARQRRLDTLRRSGNVRVELPGVGGLELAGGRLVRSWADAPDPSGDAVLALPFPAPEPTAPGDGSGALVSPGPGLALGEPLPREHADELLCVARWLDAKAARLRLVHSERGLTSSLPKLATYEPART